MVNTLNILKTLEKNDELKSILKKLVNISESFITENIKEIEKKDEARVEKYVDSLFNIEEIEEE